MANDLILVLDVVKHLHARAIVLGMKPSTVENEWAGINWACFLGMCFGAFIRNWYT